MTWSGLGDTSVRRKDIAAALNVRTEAISKPRQSLKDKGLIEDAGYGRLSFTAPGFAAYIRTEILGLDRPELPPPTDNRTRIDDLLAATQAPPPPPVELPRPATPPELYRGPEQPTERSGPER